jgi:hypothetical protein
MPKLPRFQALWILVWGAGTLGSPAGLPAARAEEGFHLPSKLPAQLRPAGYDAAVAASVQIDIDDGTWTCSASVISPDGYVLTALHCMDECLKRNHLYEKIPDSIYSGNFRSKKAAPNVLCKGHRIPELGTGDLRLVEVGNGYVVQSPEQLLELTSAEAGKRRAGKTDWAILKAELPQPAPCVPISRKALTAGQPVWVLGFPSRTSRPGGRNSDGKHEHVTYGAVSADYSGNDWVGQWSAAEREIFWWWHQSPYEFVSSADSFWGNSGGMVIDSEGKQVGVQVKLVLGGPEDLKTAYVGDNTVATRTAAVYGALAKKYGKDTADRVFSCE